MAKKKIMTVQMRTSIASREWAYGHGEVVTIDAELAQLWIQSGIAVPADGKVEDEGEVT